MRKFVFVFSMLSVCFSGAVNKESFGKMIADFNENSYESAVVTAMNFGKESDCRFKNDSKFFLREFFDCMVEEDDKLEQFREEVSSLCSNANEKELGYYLNYPAMIAEFENLAREKYENTQNPWWAKIFFSDDEEYSEGVEGAESFYEDSDFEDIDVDEVRNTNIKMNKREIIDIAMSNGWL
jgi:hypothetical protein